MAPATSSMSVSSDPRSLDPRSTACWGRALAVLAVLVDTFAGDLEPAEPSRKQLRKVCRRKACSVVYMKRQHMCVIRLCRCVAVQALLKTSPALPIART